MLNFTLRRLNLFFFTMLMLTLFSFSLSYLFPGDALINLSGQINATDEQLSQLAIEYKSNESIIWQYFAYLQHIIQGDFGVSMTTQSDISVEIINRLPATIELCLASLFLAMFIGIPLGFIAAIKHNKTLDHLILSVAMIGYSIPIFWLGLLAILIFSITLGWLPSAGQVSLLFEIESVTGFELIDILLSDNAYKWQAFQDAAYHLVLPAIVVSMAPGTIFIRLARTAMLDVLETPYIRAALAKGLSFPQVIYHHAIRNALVEIIRHVGLQFANLVTLAMITEVIFNWPGIGKWLIESIYQRDYTTIQSGLLVMSCFIFIVHILIDFIYAAINPIMRDN